MAVGAGAAAAILRRDLAALAARRTRHDPHTTAVERPVLIINRWSGDGKAEKYGLAAAAREAGIEVVMLERGDDLTELAEAAATRADAIGMAGGDGSLGLVAGVAVEHDLPFFCVPVGTRNHFALDLGLDRDNPLSALASITDGEEIRIDLGVVGGRVFLNNVSLGIYPKAVKHEGYRAEKVRTFLDMTRAAAHSTDEAPDVQFTTPDGRTFDTTPVMLVSNNEYVFSGPPDHARRRRLEAGVLGVAAMTGVPRDDTETVTIGDTGLESWKAERFVVEASSGTVEAGVDGEAIDFGSPLEFEVRRKALRVLVPRGTVPGYVTPSEALTAELLDIVRLGGEPGD